MADGARVIRQQMLDPRDSGPRRTNVANELMRMQAADGTAVLVEIDDPRQTDGFGDVAFEGAIYRAKETFEQTLMDVRAMAIKALDTLRTGPSAPDQVELEFGVKFKAELNAAIFAKTAGEGTLVVRMSWSGPVSQPGEQDDE
jgi:hypothetical protein